MWPSEVTFRTTARIIYHDHSTRYVVMIEEWIKWKKNHIYYSATSAWNIRDMNWKLLDWTWVRFWGFMTWLWQILEYLMHDTLTSLQLLVSWADDWRWVIRSQSQCNLLRNCKMWVEKKTTISVYITENSIQWCTTATFKTQNDNSQTYNAVS